MANNNNTADTATTKYFRNGKTMSAFCRMRYGSSKMIWDDTTLWEKTGPFAIKIDLAKIDAKYPPKNSSVC